MSNKTASVMGVALRASRLAQDGTILPGENNSYMTTQFVSVSITPEYEDGDEFTQKNAQGGVCVTYKAPDTLKRVGLSVALCAPDIDLTHLLIGGEKLGDGQGWAAPVVGTDANPNGLALEVWSRAIEDGKPANTDPFYHWIFPFAQFRESGDRSIGNDIMAVEFEGWAVGNSGFEGGPATPLWAYPDVTNRPYAYARTSSIPTTEGFITVDGG